MENLNLNSGGNVAAPKNCVDRIQQSKKSLENIEDQKEMVEYQAGWMMNLTSWMSKTSIEDLHDNVSVPFSQGGRSECSNRQDVTPYHLEGVATSNFQRDLIDT